MTQGFDEHWDKWCISSNCEEDEALTHFEAGAASRQAEIDELQNRIDKACSIMEDARDNKKLIAMSDIHAILRG